VACWLQIESEVVHSRLPPVEFAGVRPTVRETLPGDTFYRGIV